MCVPRSIDPSTTSPIKSPFNSVLGSALPTSEVTKVKIRGEIKSKEETPFYGYCETTALTKFMMTMLAQFSVKLA